MVAHAANGRIVRCNSAAEHLLGLTRSQVLGRSPTDPRWRTVHEDGTDFPGETHPAMVALRTGAPVLDVVMGVHTPDGSLRWITINAAPVPDAPPGSDVAVLATFTDVSSQIRQRDTARRAEERYRLLATEQMHLKELLREERRQYQALAQNASDVVLQVLPDGRIAWVSSSITELLGWHPDEVVGRDSLDLVHPDDVAAVVTNRTALEAGTIVAVRVRIRCRDGGEYRWMLAKGRAIRSTDGRLVGRAGSWRDISGEVAAEDRLLEERERYRLIAENASDVVWQMEPDGTLTWVSPSVEHILGWEPAALVGTRARDLLHPDDRPHAEAVQAAIRAGRAVDDLRSRYRAADGSYRWMSSHAKLTERSGSPGSVTVVGGLRDVTAEVAARAEGAAATALFRTAMASAAIGMSLSDETRRFVAVNDAMCDLFGRDESWFLQHQFVDLVHPADRADVSVAGDRLLSGELDSVTGEIRVVRADGAVRWVRRVVAVVRAGADEHRMILLQVEDVTDEREARSQLAFNATHDALTGLRNRAWILDVLDADLQAAERHGSHVAVLFIDVDNFKVVNDSLGHVVGDEVLRDVAQRITASLRGRGRVGRFGGDEFIVVVPGVDGTAEVEAIAARISADIGEELLVEGRRLVPSASIGIAMSAPGSTSTSLLRDADAAVFRAKAAGRSRWQFFDVDMHAQALLRITVEEELRAALARHEFVVHYQPIVDLLDATVVGHEALVRWEHPARGLLAPDVFLPTAEESGLVVEIGDQVLDDVCALLAARPDLTGPVSVNRSPSEITRPGWKERFLAVAAGHGVDPRRLVVELTETAIMSVDAAAAQDLQSLRDLGVGIHVDDFGTGYSSIALLRDLPVTGLKLDRSFAGHMVEDRTARVLAAGLAGLAEGLQLDAVAEGVETCEQAELLVAQGWRRGQGWLYGRPSPEPLARAGT
jgi:diguanylate cyclase (GGDEF)-like protein/PAS domain S-box-containing protein